MNRLKYILFFLPLLFSCENKTEKNNNDSALNHDHKSYNEDFISEFDTIINFPNNIPKIDTLNFILHKNFNIVKTNIDSCIIISETFFNKYLAPIEYLLDSSLTHLTFEKDEGDKYAIVSKTKIGKINLVLIGRNSFNAELIEFYDILVTNDQNLPLYFGYLEWDGNKLINSSYILSDSVININLKGKKYEDGFEDCVIFSLRLNMKNNTIKCKKKWNLRTVWD